MSNILCIYHGNCFDGFSAAWVVYKKYPDAEFFPGKYQSPLPDVTDKDVLLVDFSYPSKQLARTTGKIPLEQTFDALIEKAKSVTVLDHHVSAMNDLTSQAWPDKVKLTFDMERSGAGITWDYFFGHATRPPMISYVEDRDLYRWALPQSKEVHEALTMYPFDFHTWDDVMGIPIEHFMDDGEVLLRKHYNDVDSTINATKRKMKIGGHIVFVANAPPTLLSDTGEKLSEGQVFAATYFDSPQGRNFSLRSKNACSHQGCNSDCGIDVSVIAGKYGGGGHEHASGFLAPRGWEGDDT